MLGRDIPLGLNRTVRCRLVMVRRPVISTAARARTRNR
jgi:hypothetical protein